MEEVLEASLDFIENYATSDVEEKDQVLEDFLDRQLKADYGVQIDFSPDWEWFNVSQPLDFRTDLSEKVVVLDFFTYCCINCLHILPSLHQLEEKHSIEEGLVVVGVHSAKFENERDSANIAAALQRYDVTHPVVNDSQLVLWRQLGIACWPTLLVLGPGGRPLLQLVGEGHTSLLQAFAAAALRRLSPDLSRRSLPVSPSSRLAASGLLRFPGKLCRLDSNRLVVSDTGHHRLLLLDNSGAVQRVIGGPSSGYYDGGLEECKFNSPQGVAAVDGAIYVADTENHAIRKVDLRLDMVETVAGTGELGADREGGGTYRQPLASPWDLCSHDGQLYIAMAGSHQIWTLFLRDGTLFGKRDCPAGTCVRLAGSGEEANRNNSYPHRASFAQPSGLTCDPAGGRLLVADSESSSVRQVALATGAVAAVTGGARDPTNLFEFGDADSAAPGGAALLQHPLGVAWCSQRGVLYVADTYNHKLKRVTPAGRKFTCETLCGGERGDQTGALDLARFNEPGGLIVEDDGDVLLVADTNNHCIRRVRLGEGAVDTLNVRMPHDSPDRPSQTPADASTTVRCSGGAISIHVDVVLSEVSLTDGAPHSWKLGPLPPGWSCAVAGGALSLPLAARVEAPPLSAGDSAALTLRLNLYLCSPAGVCFPRVVTCGVTVEGDEAGGGPAEARLAVTVDGSGV